MFVEGQLPFNLGGPLYSFVDINYFILTNSYTDIWVETVQKLPHVVCFL